MDISEYKFNNEWVIAYVKLRLRDHFLQEWNRNLENSPKALNYRLYKQIFNLKTILIFYKIKTFSLFANLEPPIQNYP